MGAVKIWNAMEVAEEARDNPSLSSDIQSSSLTVDHSLSLPHMKPRIMFVTLLSLSLSLSFTNAFESPSLVCRLVAEKAWENK